MENLTDLEERYEDLKEQNLGYTSRKEYGQERLKYTSDKLNCYVKVLIGFLNWREYFLNGLKPQYLFMKTNYVL